MERLLARRLLLVVACLALVSIASGRRATVGRSEEPDLSGQLPRIPPKEASRALRSFALHPDFRIEQVAAEPLLADPVAISFDEGGRLYVVEMRDYSEQVDDHLGRVRLLEDRDGDGVYDAATTFADGLSWPTAALCYDGGLFVAAAPDIWFMKDTDGDRRADVRRRVFTGFGRANVQGLVNSFAWGIDNRIHGATSSAGGAVRRADRPEAPPLLLRGRDFAFDPRSLEIQPTSGGGQHGMCFDDWGRKFVCSNSDHAQCVVFDERYLERNPYLVPQSTRVSIAADGPQAEVFRTSPLEPWRVVRTRLRVAGVVPGPVEGGGRAGGYFTGATGITVYRGDAWPGEYRGQLFVGDVGSNIIHRKTVSWSGLEPRAQRADPGREFLSSTDNWFRPVQFANAPDGALYVLDFYREVIEHPESLPPVIKRHLDLTSGRNRGRLYRVLPRKPLPARGTLLGGKTPMELVGFLAHPNAWHRETASRLIYAAQDRRCAPLLRALLGTSRSELGRLHALYALKGLGMLDREDLLLALADASGGVRRHAVFLAESRLVDDAALRQRVSDMASDDDPQVRLQVALSIGEFQGEQMFAALATIVRRDPESPWIRLAVHSSLGETAWPLARMFWHDTSFRDTQEGRSWCGSLATQIARCGRPEEIRALWELMIAAKNVAEDRPSRRAAATVLLGLAEGAGSAGVEFHRWLESHGVLDPQSRLAPLTEAAAAAAVNRALPPESRAEAIALLTLADWGRARGALEELLRPDEPVELQTLALETLARFEKNRWDVVVLQRWLALTPRPRRVATRLLLARRDSARSLLESVAQGLVPKADLEATDIAFLKEHHAADIRARARELLADDDTSDRQAVLSRHLPVLEMAGDAKQGREVFRRVCAPCHVAEGIGQDLAPSLAAFAPRGPEALLQSILEPNREVNPAYVAHLVVTRGGQAFTGILISETSSGVVLRLAEGSAVTIPRSELEEIRSTGLSLMPEGLERQIDMQEMADLLAYLAMLGEPGREMAVPAEVSR